MDLDLDLDLDNAFESRSTSRMSFRRSIIGSLRSRSVRSPIAIEHHPRNDSTQSGRDTPASKLFLRPIVEERRPRLARDVDLYVDTGEGFNMSQVFEELIARPDIPSHGHPAIKQTHLFRLPSIARMMIYDYCLPEEAREISLSPNFATKDVFPGGYYASPWDVLEPVWGAIRSSRKLRHEVMAYFWIRYHFKITLSTFSGPIYSPLSHVWLLEYLPIIQRLTIEVDLTRLGGSSIKGAPRLNYDNDKINMFVATIVKGLLKRRGGVIEELNLMCRRYDGSRLNHSKGLEIQVPYCFDEIECVRHAFTHLRGLVLRARISGFTLPYTEMLLSTLFGAGVDYDVPSKSAWPPPPFPKPSLFNSPPIRAGSTTPRSTFEVTLTRSPSFAQSFEDELTKYETKASIQHMLVPRYNIEAEDSYDSCSDTGYKSYVPQRRPSSSASRVSKKTIVGTLARLSAKSQFDDEEVASMNTSEDRREYLTPTPDQASRCRTPTSPNTMNTINERDPAFLRTVSALQSPALRSALLMKPRPYSDPSSEKRKPETLMDANRGKGYLGVQPHFGDTKKIYTKLLNKLRGRAVTN